VHVQRRHDLPKRRRALASQGRMNALNGTGSGVNSEAVEQVLEPRRIATGQHGEAFQAEQREHFINRGVAGGDVAVGVIVSLQYGEAECGGRDLRRRHRRGLLGKIGSVFAALRHQARLYHITGGDRAQRASSPLR
jgi:hypothetical protein